ncbi:MAG TPA: hypothetical protein VMX18_00435 [Candidatus Bipolaricaulota bacterium]|nr:hypothetical protein [Candidatus Bipolaricaulota bacterium]
MKEKYFKILRVAIWLMAVGVLAYFFADYFSIDGSFYLKYEVGRPIGQVSRFYAPENYQIISDAEKTFVEINKTPTAFDLKLPTKFEKATIVLTYRTEDSDGFRFGPISDQGKTRFETEKIETSANWREQAFEFNLADAYFSKNQGYSFVFETSGGTIEVASIQFDLQRKKLWQSIGEKLK